MAITAITKSISTKVKALALRRRCAQFILRGVSTAHAQCVFEEIHKDQLSKGKNLTLTA